MLSGLRPRDRTYSQASSEFDSDSANFSRAQVETRSSSARPGPSGFDSSESLVVVLKLTPARSANIRSASVKSTRSYDSTKSKMSPPAPHAQHLND